MRTWDLLREASIHVPPFLAPLALPFSMMLGGSISLAAAFGSAEHNDAVLVLAASILIVAVILVALRMLFHDHEKREDKKIRDHTAAVVTAMEEARRYPAQVANIYGPISEELKRLHARVHILQQHAHVHPASIPHVPAIPEPSQDGT